MKGFFPLACVLCCLLATGCKQTAPAVEAKSVAGDQVRGQHLLATYGCAACHRIKDVAPSQNQVGPDLRSVADNSYLAGILPNTQQNMMRWLMHPRSISPGTAMPELGVTEKDARDMAAYLYAQ
jgi:cytochrome c2